MSQIQGLLWVMLTLVALLALNSITLIFLAAKHINLTGKGVNYLMEIRDLLKDRKGE